MPDIQVLSEVQARVCKVEVTVGDVVAPGDTLMILESMKMELPVEAPAGGRIAQILAVDSLVEEDHLLVVIAA